MFAELGDAPFAMRIAGDQPSISFWTRPRPRLMYCILLPLSNYQKHLNGPRGFVDRRGTRQGEDQMPASIAERQRKLVRREDVDASIS